MRKGKNSKLRVFFYAGLTHNCCVSHWQESELENVRTQMQVFARLLRSFSICLKRYFCFTKVFSNIVVHKPRAERVQYSLFLRPEL